MIGKSVKTKRWNPIEFLFFHHHFFFLCISSIPYELIQSSSICIQSTRRKLIFFFLISKSRIVPTRWRWKNRRQLRKIKKEIQRDYRHKDFVCCCTEWIESEIFFLFFLVWFMLLVVCLFGATIGQSKQFSNLNLVKRMSQYLLCLACLC